LPHEENDASSNEFSEAARGQSMSQVGANRTLLALDPGGTTGWCQGTLMGKLLYLRVGQTKFSLLDVYDAIHKTARMSDNVDLIYETFEYRNLSRAGLDLTPVKIIGVIELYLEMSPFVIKGCGQNAAKGKGYYTDTKLKEYGVYAKSFQHGRDATRHLMHYLTFGPGSQYGDIDTYTIEMSTSHAFAEGSLS
jgi:hypothetical protein